MPKVTVRNRAEPKWQPVIETKLQLMLGSMLAHISRVDVDFDRVVEPRDQRVSYACSLLVIENNGETYRLCNDQPEANLAIEGTFARARRAITRLRRARMPAWRQASAR